MRRHSCLPRNMFSLLLCMSSLSYAAGPGMPAQSQTSSNGSRPFRLVLSSDADFDQLLRQHFAGILGSDMYSLIRATTVLVSNETNVPVRAFTVSWTLDNPDGSRESLYTTVFPDSKHSHLLPGVDPALGAARYGLISPFAHVEEDGREVPEVSSLQRYLDSYADIGSSSSQRSILSKLAAAKQITVELDGAVFSNGTFIGRDTFGLWQKFTCEHNGAIQEAISLGRVIGQGDSPRNTLERDATLSLAPPNPDSGCLAARGREAARLLEVLQKNGANRLEQAVAIVSRGQEVVLHRLRR